MRSAVTTLAMAAALLSLGACAGGSKPPPPGPAEIAVRKTPSVVGLLFSRFDTNLDYRISKDELNVGIDRAFASADADGDKSISPLEFETFSQTALGGKSAPPYRLDFDRNVDSHITPLEFKTELLAIAEGLDTDKDGVLSQEELTKVTPGAKEPGERGANGGPDGGERHGPPGRRGGGMPPADVSSPY